jgi:hypothetical protein
MVPFFNLHSSIFILHFLCHVVDHLLINHLIFGPTVLDLEVFAFPLHLLDQILAADLLQVPDPPVLVPVLRAILGINILARIDLHLKLVVAAFQGAVHDHGDDFGITVLECLVLYINVFRLGPLPDAVPVLAVLRAVLGNMNSEEYLAASRIQTLLFPKLLTASRLG